MEPNWRVIAQRIVRGIGVQAGELIQVRDESGRFDLLLELLLALEKVGATPLPQLTPAFYMERLWAAAPAAYLGKWDAVRAQWLHACDRVIVLAGAMPDFTQVPAEPFAAWQTAEQRLTEIEEARQLPYLLVAVPTRQKAAQLGLEAEALESLLLPALAVGINALQERIGQMLHQLQGGAVLTVYSGESILTLKLANRPWLSDDGHIDDADRARGAIVSNLPAGSVYTTVDESQTSGALWLPQAGPAQDVTLTFANGRIAHIDAAAGAAELSALFDQHSGEPRRIGHIGIGLNPKLRRPIGWTLVDEHVPGHLFISFGENRYMGGANASSLNVDFALPGATLRVDGRSLIVEGKLQ